MNDEKFNELDRVADDVQLLFEKILESGELSKLKKAMETVMIGQEDRYSVDLTFGLTIFDSERMKTIEIAGAGLTCNSSGEAYPVHSGETFNRYLCNGRIVEIPHSYCPNCWSEWDFKGIGQKCPDCSLEFGKDIKLLLDSDICPMCNEGSLSTEDPRCKECDFYADPALVVWG